MIRRPVRLIAYDVAQVLIFIFVFAWCMTHGG